MNPETLKRLDPLARRVGFYTAYTLSESEYIGHTRDPYAKQMLQTGGCERSPTFMGLRLEAAKLHPTSGRVHDWSLRKVDPRDHRKQYHVHAWTNEENVTMLYSHREYRPDVRPVGGESLREMYDRLRTHYRPEYGEDYEQGEACDDLQELVDGHE